MKTPLAIEPHRAAALFVDLQEEHRRDRRYLVEGFDAVIGNVQRLQRAARAARIPVLHSAYVVDLAAQRARPFHPVMADGTSAFSDANDPMSEICAEVGPTDGEPVLVKSDASAFAGGGLAGRLAALGTEWLFVAGVWTEACIAQTVKDAVDLGIRVALVKDACGSGSAAMHQTAILNLANRLYGGAVVDTEGACRLMGGEAVEVWRVQGSVPLRFTYDNAARLYLDL
ncbi:isochorismatase family protein [Inquilinus limosus]|uniref:Isochorismatase n=1 Tax=Inquilinus limosus MP06 TaxID=1398085 RepID=A0A0A0D3V0_9PROT|nr:isochorismatase family protein [Inquilinus limosus]KGM32784.1 isochorismatase [Inquilinus limosus MP06]